MIVERYTDEKHGESVRSWCRERSMSVFPEAWLPEIVFIVPGVLAAWLYKTDSGCAWIENVISNPETTKEERAEAIDAVSGACVAEARRSGFAYVLGFSAIPTVKACAERLGFTVSQEPYFTLVKEIRS